MPFYSVADRPAIGYGGQLAEPGAPKYAVSKTAEGTIVAGRPVKRGTDAEKQVLAAAAGDTVNAATFAGIALLSTSRPFDASAPIEAGDSLSVLRLGVVYLDFSEAVTAGEIVGWNAAAATWTGWAEGTAAGSITTGVKIYPGLRVCQTTSGAGPARVEVNLMGLQAAATVGSG